MTTVQPIPPGFHSITPHLVLHDTVAAIDFYKRAFDAVELHRLDAPDGKIMHASLRIGDSIIMMGDECREYGVNAPTSLGGSPVTIHLYVPNADDVFAKAVFNGATVVMPVQEMFWGDRYGKLVDPFGHCWSIATCVRQMNPAEMKKASEQAFCMAQ
jgi:uncharacterized glyoxalase superfamily protein PhnB